MSNNNAQPPLTPRDLGLTDAQVARHTRQVLAEAAANVNPTPGPLAAAFPTQDILVCGLRVRPFVAYDFPILRQLDSPLLKQLEQAARPDEVREQTKFTDQEGFEMVWQFTHPCREVKETLERMGRDNFRAYCETHVGYSMNPVVVQLIAAAVGRQFALSFETALKYKAANGADDGTVFTPPPPAPATASAGGSTMCAASPAT